MAESNTNINTSAQINRQTYKDYAIESMMSCSVDPSLTDEFVKHLHETLDIYQLLNSFSEVFKEKIQCDGMEYNDDVTQTYYLSGEKGQPSCIYTLRYEEQILGTISISRDSVFMDYEIETIEVLLAGLTLPLRNAIRYKQSIQLSQRDELTGLRNGCYYSDLAELEVKRAQRYKTPFSILLFDIDNFDLINRKYGRDIGDAVLIEVAKRLETKARSSDIVYRNNGDEFLVFLPNTEKTKAIEAVERIKDYLLKDKFIALDKSIELNLSVSVATVTYEDTANKLMDRARKLLLDVKTFGEDQIYSKSSMECVQAGNL